jgi:hypothetical protein
MPVDIRKPLKKFIPHFLDARAAKLREAETVQRIERLFEHVLGYDGLTDISREAQIKGKYCDLALKIDGSVRLLVEAKASNEPLRDRHVDQAQSYASRANLQWVVLTNGVEWRLYHLTFEEGIDYEVAFQVNLEDPEGFDDACCKLGLLHKLAIKKGELEDFWRTATALGPESIARGLFQEDTLRVIRRWIRKHEGFLVDPEDLARSIHGILSTEARELIGPLRIGRARKAVRRNPAAGGASGDGKSSGVGGARGGDAEQPVVGDLSGCEAGEDGADEEDKADREIVRDVEVRDRDRS